MTLQAPAFGEDDYRVCIAHGIIAKGQDLPCPVDDNGCFTEVVVDFAGQYVKEADKHITKKIKEIGRLVRGCTCGTTSIAPGLAVPGPWRRSLEPHC